MGVCQSSLRKRSSVSVSIKPLEDRIVIKPARGGAGHRVRSGDPRHREREAPGGRGRRGRSGSHRRQRQPRSARRRASATPSSTRSTAAPRSSTAATTCSCCRPATCSRSSSSSDRFCRNAPWSLPRGISAVQRGRTLSGAVARPRAGVRPRARLRDRGVRALGLPPALLPAAAPAAPFEIVALRILLALVFCAILLTVTRAWRAVPRPSRGSRACSASWRSPAC